LLARSDELKAFFEEALHLNTSRAEDIKLDTSGRSLQDESFQNFQERHEKISYDWGKAKSVLKKSMNMY
jgi:hypothetical protein